MTTKTKAKAKQSGRSQPPRQRAKSKVKVRAPDGMQTLSPHLVCRGAAEAIDFYKKAFGATEKGRLPGPNGKLMHAQVFICGSSVMLVDEMLEYGALSPKALKGTPVTMHLYVDDVDGFFNRAVKAGATVKMPVDDMFWGDRYGIIVDPFGHQWSVAACSRREHGGDAKGHGLHVEPKGRGWWARLGARPRPRRHGDVQFGLCNPSSVQGEIN
jgi:uncharacterized glyoxalase superfamily protein PhnB